MRGHQPDDLAFVHQVGNALCRRGWRRPALVALEVGRPLGFILGQFLWVVEPASRFGGWHQITGRLATLFEEPESLDALIDYLATAHPEGSSVER